METLIADRMLNPPNVTIAEPQTALVTGGLGFIGSTLVDKLVDEGWVVRVWDDLSSGKNEYKNDKATYHEIDVSKITPKVHAEPHAPPVDVIFHLGALARIQPSFDAPLNTLDINMMGTANVMEMARLQKAKVVYAGCSSYYFDLYANPYAFTKWQGEEIARLYSRVYNVPVAIARFFNVYGPRQPMEGKWATVVGIFERQYAAGEPLTITGTGEQRRDFTHVDDIVTGLIKMSEGTWKAEQFDLGTGRNHSINELAALFKTDVVHINQRPGEADVTKAGVWRTEQLLDWTPQVVLEDYVETFLQNSA